LLASRGLVARVLATGTVGAVLLAGCSTHPRTQKLIDSIIQHVDQDRSTSLDDIGFEMVASTGGGRTLTILGSRQLSPPTPGSTKRWAELTVKIVDPYASGPAGQPTDATDCYIVTFTYYGEGRATSTECPYDPSGS
jgi:hypothetical protein